MSPKLGLLVAVPVAVGLLAASSPAHAYYYRGGYGYGGGYGFGGDPFFDVEQVSRYTSAAEVVMGHGAKPPSTRAYDARAVIAHLQGTIQYPETKS